MAPASRATRPLRRPGPGVAAARHRQMVARAALDLRTAGLTLGRSLRPPSRSAKAKVKGDEPGVAPIFEGPAGPRRSPSAYHAMQLLPALIAGGLMLSRFRRPPIAAAA